MIKGSFPSFLQVSDILKSGYHFCEMLKGFGVGLEVGSPVGLFEGWTEGILLGIDKVWLVGAKLGVELEDDVVSEGGISMSTHFSLHIPSLS